MTKPKTIRVLGKEYRVEWDAVIDNPDPEAITTGDNLQPILRIRIHKGLALDEERETLIHELVHAVENQLDLPMSEKTVRRLSVGLYALLRDNPKLRSYLFKGANK